MVNIPTRPENIRNIKIILEKTERVGVTERESPTVAKAEVHSYNASRKLTSVSIPLMRNVETSIARKGSNTKVRAR